MHMPSARESFRRGMSEAGLAAISAYCEFVTILEINCLAFSEEEKKECDEMYLLLAKRMRLVLSL